MNPKKVVCPITGSEDVIQLNHFDEAITSDGILVRRPVMNYLSIAAGLIFNAAGARGNEEDFYREEYVLHSESTTTEFMYFDQGAAIGVYDGIINFIGSSTSLPREGAILDVGCGKGLFLKGFHTKFPDWKLAGVEPSKSALEMLTRIVPEAAVFGGAFEDSPFIAQQFDLVAANGVAEHVPDPLAFLRSIAQCLKPGGIAYIGVPNFENNPADFYTFDHLSRFTPQSLEHIASRAGLETVRKQVLPTRVPMWFVFRKRGSSSDELPPQSKGSALDLVKRHQSFIEATFRTYNECAEALKPGDKVGVYGTGAMIYLGSKYSRLTPDKIFCLYDDNTTLWGHKKLGLEVRDPKKVVGDGCSHIVFSANPCYLESMTAKIRSYIGNHPLTLHTI